MTVEAALLDAITDLVGRRNLSQREFQDWMAGSATGGPGGDGRYPLTDSTGYERLVPSPAAVGQLMAAGIGKSVRTPQQHMGPYATISNAVQAGDGTWSGNNAAPAINAAIQWCSDQGGGTVFIPAGKYLIASAGNVISGETRVRGILRMKRGVKIRSDGAELILSGGRHNPPSMFFHHYLEDDNVDNVLIEGLTIDNNMSKQTWDLGDASGGPSDSDFQYQHGIEWLDGDNVEIARNVIKNTRGSGVAAGNVFVSAMDVDTSFRVNIHHNEFFNCYREAAIIPWACGGSFDHNHVHGDGYLVAAVDLERHTAKERIEAFHVHHNLFDFRDGYGPIERRKLVRMRRAVSMAFFYAGYPDNQDDGHFGKLIVDHNIIYQGQIDHWGPTDVIIDHNIIVIENEDLVVYDEHGVPKEEYGAPMKVRYVSEEGIKAYNHQGISALQGPIVDHNIVISTMKKSGIWCFNYRDCQLTGNKVKRTAAAGILMDYCGGTVSGNMMEDVGTPMIKSPGIAIKGSQDAILATGNMAVDTRNYDDPTLGDLRGTTYAVEVIAAVDKPLLVTNNIGRNLLEVGESFKPFPGQENVAAWANTNGDSVLRSNGDIVVGSGTSRARLKLDGSAGEEKAIHFMKDGEIEAMMGLYGADGDFALFYMLNATTFGGNWMTGDRQTGDVTMNSGRFTINGTWQKPMYFAGAVRLWCDPATGIFYRSYNDPTGPTDGFVMNGSPAW